MHVLYMSYSGSILTLDQRDGDSEEIGGALYVGVIPRRKHHLSPRNKFFRVT